MQRGNDDSGQQADYKKNDSPNEVVDENGDEAAPQAGQWQLDGHQLRGVDVKLISNRLHGDYSLQSVARETPPLLGPSVRAAGCGRSRRRAAPFACRAARNRATLSPGGQRSLHLA